MRVLLVGGAGGVGGAVLPLLASSPDLGLIVVADRDVASCEARVSGIDGTVAESVDAEQTASVAELVKRHEIDLIVNVAGPYSVTLMPVLQAAVESGVNYVDVAEGAAETIEGLALDDAAKEIGAVCLLGLGNFPGLTNILAVQAANRLQSVSRAAVAIAISAAAVAPDETVLASMKTSGRVGAGWRSMVEAASRPAHIYRNQTASFAPAGTLQDMTTPSGHAVSLALHDHSEPITLPRHLSTVSEAITCLGFVPKEGDNLFRLAAQSVADGDRSADHAVIEFFQSVIDRREQLALHNDSPFAELWADVEGIWDGRPARVTSWAAGPLPPSAKILAASIKGVASRQIDQPGVHTAEALSTETFLSLLARETGADLNSLIEYRVAPLG